MQLAAISRPAERIPLGRLGAVKFEIASLRHRHEPRQALWDKRLRAPRGTPDDAVEKARFGLDALEASRGLPLFRIVFVCSKCSVPPGLSGQDGNETRLEILVIKCTGARREITEALSAIRCQGRLRRQKF